jgi:hypothetical protein
MAPYHFDAILVRASAKYKSICKPVLKNIDEINFFQDLLSEEGGFPGTDSQVAFCHIFHAINIHNIPPTFKQPLKNVKCTMLLQSNIFMGQFFNLHYVRQHIILSSLQKFHFMFQSKNF